MLHWCCSPAHLAAHARAQKSCRATNACLAERTRCTDGQAPAARTACPWTACRPRPSAAERARRRPPKSAPRQRQTRSRLPRRASAPTAALPAAGPPPAPASPSAAARAWPPPRTRRPLPLQRSTKQSLSTVKSFPLLPFLQNKESSSITYYHALSTMHTGLGKPGRQPRMKPPSYALCNRSRGTGGCARGRRARHTASRPRSGASTATIATSVRAAASAAATRL